MYHDFPDKKLQNADSGEYLHLVQFYQEGRDSVSPLQLAKSKFKREKINNNNPI